MLENRAGRFVFTAVALLAVWGVAAIIFVRIVRGRPEQKVDAPPVIPRTFDFISWPDPDAVFLLSGQQHGYLEPCGCTEGQTGGLGRRHSLIKRLEQRGWPVGLVDLGGLIDGYGRQAELKFQTALTALDTLGYQTIGLGLNDVNLPAGMLLSQIHGDHVPVPFTSANLPIFGTNLLASHRLFETGDVTVAVAAVFGGKYKEQIQNSDIEWNDPDPALEEARDAVKKADVRLLLAYAPLDETEELAQKFPEYDLVVTAGGAEEPADPKPFDPGRLLIETGEKGKNALLVAFYKDSEPRFRSELVPLDSRFQDTPEWEEQLAAYVSVLKQEQLVENLSRQAHPDGAEFVGAEACGKCHTEAFRKWQSSKHFRATQVIQPKDRHFDPECVRCHTTGWEPQLTIPWQSGYVSLEATPHLVGNGCENCHGPGSRHVAAEQASVAGQSPAELNELRAAMRLDLETAEKHLCISCHDADNSHDFEFKKYWEQIVHRGVK